MAWTPRGECACSWSFRTDGSPVSRTAAADPRAHTPQAAA
jgi:hypothetical protein